MPITGQNPRKIFFDPNLPPGNAVPVQGCYPLLFDLATEAFQWGPGYLRLWSEFSQGSHACCVEGWRRILSGFFPEERMISEQSIGHSFKDLSFLALTQSDYTDVNTRYKAAKAEYQGTRLEDDDATDALEYISLHSIDTAKGLNLITRTAVTPDLVISAASDSRLEVHKREVLLVGEIKQLLPQPNEPKHRLFIMGSLCQALRYLAYSREIFGTSYALVAFGRLHRCIWLVGTTLYVDLGPGPEPAELVPMELHNLLLQGNRMGEDPTTFCWDLARPEAQQRLKTFFKHMGQQYINEVHGWPLFWPHGQLVHPLGQNRIAVIEGFTIESLAEACVKCQGTMHAEFQRRQAGPQGGQRDGGIRNDGSSNGVKRDSCDNTDDDHVDEEVVPLLVASTSADTMLSSTSNDDIPPPPPTSDTDARLRLILNEKETSMLKDLKDTGGQYGNYGLPADVEDDLRGIARAALDGGEDVASLLRMF